MLQNLSNTNGSGTGSAVINKKISDLENEVSEINTCLGVLSEASTTASTDIATIKECVACGTFECNVSGDVIEAREKLVTDTISGDTSDTITIEDDIAGQNASFATVTATEVSDSHGNTLSSVQATASGARATAESAVNGVATLATVVDADKLDLENYKQAISTCVATSCVDATNIRASSVVSNSTCTSCLVSNNAETARLETEAITYGGILEPTSKDEEEYYEVILPANFSGKASFVGVDSNNKVLFSATIDNTIANTDLQDREGTALVIHSGITKFDFYQVLRKRDTDVVSFITKSNVAKIFWQYSNYDKTEEPTYVIYSNLADNGPDYDSYSTVYTAEHSDQVVVFGSENTLNGGLTVFGTFQATAFEAPESEVTNVYVKNQIYGGYDCNTGEYTTCGTRGGIITYNKRDETGEYNVSWINGEPRQVVRKSATPDSNSITDGTPPSDLTFETVKTYDLETETFKPSMTDSLFDEAALATYEGVTANDNYPIKHLNANACAHGKLDVEGDLMVGGEVIVDKDVSVKGDLYVAGTVTTTEETQVATSGDYLVTRLNSPIAMSSNEYSGLAVNVCSDKLATITADCNGEWRVADSSTASATTYTNVHNFNNAWYSGTNQSTPTTVATGVIKASDFEGLSDTVYYNSSYYHKSASSWYSVVIDTTNKEISLGAEITDETTITALEALDKYTLEFYFSLTVTSIDSSVNQPLLTRSEKSALCNNDILVWDATNHRATNAPRPTTDGQVLVSSASGPAWVSNVSINDAVVNGTLDVSGAATFANDVTVSGTIHGTATNATCFNGCTYAQACADIRNYTPSNATEATRVNATVTGTGTCNLVYGKMADNDYFRISIGGTASNAGYAEIATADDGNEPIYVRQYSGTFSTLTRTATLLDGSGNTSFPGTVTATSFSGTATNATCFNGCTFAQACTTIRSGLTSCTGTVTVSNTTSTSAIPIALCTGATSIGKSNSCSFTFTPSTGVVTATTFAGSLSGTATNATCFNGCTFAQACTAIRSGLTSCTGTVTSVNVSVNGVSGTAVTTSGTVTLTNVPPYFANGTLYKVGDDVCIGDVNQAGMLGIRSQNNTSYAGIKFIQCNGTASGCLYACASDNCLYYNGTKLGGGSATPSGWGPAGFPQAGIVVYNPSCGLMYDCDYNIGLDTDEGILYATEFSGNDVTTQNLVVHDNVDITGNGCQLTTIAQCGYVSTGFGYFSYVRSGIKNCVAFKELTCTSCPTAKFAMYGLQSGVNYSAMGTYDGLMIKGFCYDSQRIMLYVYQSITACCTCTCYIACNDTSNIPDIYLVAPGNQR